MSKLILINSFSLNMIREDVFLNDPLISVRNVSDWNAQELAKTATSAVGHADTAALYCRLLGVGVTVNRATVQLGLGDRLLVGQYRGPRLPEGATVLPEGARIDWCVVTIQAR